MSTELSPVSEPLIWSQEARKARVEGRPINAQLVPVSLEGGQEALLLIPPVLPTAHNGSSGNYLGSVQEVTGYPVGTSQEVPEPHQKIIYGMRKWLPSITLTVISIIVSIGVLVIVTGTVIGGTYAINWALTNPEMVAAVLLIITVVAIIMGLIWVKIKQASTPQTISYHMMSEPIPKERPQKRYGRNRRYIDDDDSDIYANRRY